MIFIQRINAEWKFSAYSGRNWKPVSHLGLLVWFQPWSYSKCMSLYKGLTECKFYFLSVHIYQIFSELIYFVYLSFLYTGHGVCELSSFTPTLTDMDILVGHLSDQNFVLDQCLSNWAAPRGALRYHWLFFCLFFYLFLSLTIDQTWGVWKKTFGDPWPFI